MMFGSALRHAVASDAERFDRVANLKETHQPMVDVCRSVLSPHYSWEGEASSQIRRNWQCCRVYNLPAVIQHSFAADLMVSEAL